VKIYSFEVKLADLYQLSQLIIVLAHTQ